MEMHGGEVTQSEKGSQDPNPGVRAPNLWALPRPLPPPSGGRLHPHLCPNSPPPSYDCLPPSKCTHDRGVSGNTHQSPLSQELPLQARTTPTSHWGVVGHRVPPAWGPLRPPHLSPSGISFSPRHSSRSTAPSPGLCTDCSLCPATSCTPLFVHLYSSLRAEPCKTAFP